MTERADLLENASYAGVIVKLVKEARNITDSEAGCTELQQGFQTLREKIEDAYNLICKKSQAGEELTQFEITLRHAIYEEDMHWEMMNSQLREEWHTEQKRLEAQEWEEATHTIEGELRHDSRGHLIFNRDGSRIKRSR